MDDAVDGPANAADCDADCGDGLQNCSLRDAIFAANGNGDGEIDGIIFNIPGPGPHTLFFASGLPTLNTPVHIDGYTQPGSSRNTLETGGNAVLMVELDGSTAGPSTNGVSLTPGSSGSTIEGLVIHGFTTTNVRLDADDTRFLGNFIGTDVQGELPGASLGLPDGIFIKGANNVIGGPKPGDRNVISGNAFVGIAVVGENAWGNIIQGNHIGADVTGTQNVGNGYVGISLLFGSHDNLIGGIEPGAGNVIAFNEGSGVSVSDLGGGNAVLGNSIFSNFENESFADLGLGIDLNGDGITPNDLGDLDEGPNRLQNFPELSEAFVLENGQVLFQVSLNSEPNQEYRLEFFANEACDASGYGEGKIFLGSIDFVNTDAGGSAAGATSFATTLTAQGGFFLTATATSLDGGDTSEFSPCVQVLQAAEQCGNDADDDGDGSVDCSDPDCAPQPSCQEGQQPPGEGGDEPGSTEDCQSLPCPSPTVGPQWVNGGACSLGGGILGEENPSPAPWISFGIFLVAAGLLGVRALGRRLGV